MKIKKLIRYFLIMPGAVSNRTYRIWGQLQAAPAGFGNYPFKDLTLYKTIPLPISLRLLRVHVQVVPAESNQILHPVHYIHKDRGRQSEFDRSCRAVLVSVLPIPAY